MKYIKRLFVVGLTAALLGCGGGGGDAGTSVYGTGGTTTSGSGSDGTGTSGTTTTPTTSTASSIDVLTSANTVATAGEQISVTAIVKTSGNVGVPNAPVTFSSTTGTLTGVSVTTDSNGLATAKFSAGANKSNRTAVVSVVSGIASGSISLPISGSKISIAGPTTVRLGGVASLTLKAVDSNGNSIPNVEINISSSLGNGLSTVVGTTNAQGQISVDYTATKSGSDTVGYSGAGVAGSLLLVISGEDFTFTSPAASASVPVDTDQPLQVRYIKNGIGVQGKTVNFSATNGVLSVPSAVTDSSGVASVSIRSTTAAAATVLAQINGESIQASLPLGFVATVPARLILQASPTAVGPNVAGASANQAQVLAKVLDANGNPVPGIAVNFSRDTDPSGGNLLQPSAVTDINGQATVQYVAGAQSTSSNGVKLHAVVAANPAVSGDAALTVSQAALFIALGTGNVMSNVDPQTYKKDWVVYVTDANGVAVSNVELTVKVLPTLYRKGSMAFDENANSWVVVSSVFCPNEDAIFGVTDARSYNGVLNQGEDFNGNGKLEPGNVISVSPGVLRTDSSGRATLSLIYAESYVPWVEVTLQVQAIVSGTASMTNATFVVVGLASDLTDKNVSPAGRFSPFGVASSCTDPN